MLVIDKAAYRGFGAISPTGKDCPVPEQKRVPIIGIGYTTQEDHEAWCDCMYSYDAAINKRCKLSVREDALKYLALPWTPIGKDVRCLPGSACFTDAALALVDAAKPTGGSAQTTTGGSTQSTGGSAQTTTGGSTTTTGAGGRVDFIRPGGKRDLIPFYPGQQAPPQPQPQYTPPPPPKPEGMGTGTMVALGLAGVAAVFLLPRLMAGNRGSAPAMAGYTSRRRRSRRSRR